MFFLFLPEKQKAFMMKLVIWSRVRRDLACACNTHNILVLGSLPFLTPFTEEVLKAHS